VSECDAYALGLSSIALGAGRTRADQKVDPSAGIELCRTRGERVTRGQPLALIHARTAALAKSQAASVEQAFRIGSAKPRARRVVLERITR
jgi:pyrimidine-nucleoside phosphorylase